MSELWPQVLTHLSNELSEQQMNTWLRPLQAVQEQDVLRLLAPNRFAVDWVQSNAAARISTLLRQTPGGNLKLVWRWARALRRRRARTVRTRFRRRPPGTTA
jgi:chromosomal replication initiator protein